VSLAIDQDQRSHIEHHLRERRHALRRSPESLGIALGSLHDVSGLLSNFWNGAPYDTMIKHRHHGALNVVNKREDM
jgi:hypothetical protein